MAIAQMKLAKPQSRVLSVNKNIIAQNMGETKILGGSHLKRTQMLDGNFEKNPKEIPRSCFKGVA